MSDYKGIAYLQRKLAIKRQRVLLRYAFYEQKQRADDFGISTPEGLEWFQAVNGWCTKAVDGLADRLQFDGFENDNFMMQEMFNLNNPDIIFDSSMLNALITSVPSSISAGARMATRGSRSLTVETRPESLTTLPIC